MNLLFDYGGVLVDLDKQRCIRAFEALGFDIRPYLGTYAQAGFFSELERGAISVEASATRYVRRQATKVSPTLISATPGRIISRGCPRNALRCC